MLRRPGEPAVMILVHVGRDQSKPHRSRAVETVDC
jgi:hypothetical protein